MSIFLTRGKALSARFVDHIEHAPNVFLYKLGSQHIPSSVCFPKAETVTLINCQREGVFNALTPYMFPNIRQIYYLSAHPGSYKIHERFVGAPRWIFPTKDYPFYTYMETLGLGKRDPALLSRTLKNKRIVDGVNGFDISFHFDLEVPGWGLVEGEWWRDQFHEYCAAKQVATYLSVDEELL